MDMSTVTERSTARVTGISPLLFVEDLDRATAYFRDRLGFTLDFVYDGFYASVSRDGFSIHLKHGDNLATEKTSVDKDERLDAFIAVSGIRDLFDEIQRRGANVIKGLEQRPWNCIDFYVEDPDGHVLGFSELIA
jgi:catechol 2,3-dioxygenase-like lactoylglutathione lyase family enzyme